MQFVVVDMQLFMVDVQLFAMVLGLTWKVLHGTMQKCLKITDCHADCQGLAGVAPEMNLMRHTSHIYLCQVQIRLPTLD